MNNNQILNLKKGDIVYHRRFNVPVVFVSIIRTYSFDGMSDVNLNNPCGYGATVKPLDGYKYNGKMTFNRRYKWGNGAEVMASDLSIG